MNGYSLPAYRQSTHERTVIVLAAGERRMGTSVSAALLALASSSTGPTLCVEAGDRNAGIRWNAASAPAQGFASLANGAPVPSVALAVSGSLDAIQSRGSEDEHSPHRPKAAFEQLQGMLHLYDTTVVDASTSLSALMAACEAGARVGARVELVMLSSPGGSSLAATHALLKGASRMGVRARASVLVAAHEHEAAAGVHAMLAAAAERFLGESLGFAGAICRDASLAVALDGGMTLLDAASGSPALDGAVLVVNAIRQQWPAAGGLHAESQTVAAAGDVRYPVAPGAVLSGAGADR